jgi:hypothetical protein
MGVIGLIIGYNKAMPYKDKAAAAEWHSRNYANNREQIRAQQKEWREKNKERTAIVERAYRQANLAKVNAKTSKRRAAKLQRTPAWLDATDYFEIECVYLYCAALRSCGLDYHVDHIIPLQGKRVSGLHVPSNLQVIPAKENHSKRESYTPT